MEDKTQILFDYLSSQGIKNFPIDKDGFVTMMGDSTKASKIHGFLLSKNVKNVDADLDSFLNYTGLKKKDDTISETSSESTSASQSQSQSPLQENSLLSPTITPPNVKWQDINQVAEDYKAESEKKPVQEKFLNPPKFSVEFNSNPLMNMFPVSEEKFNEGMIKQSKWGTLSDFLEMSKVSPADIGLMGQDVNYDREISYSDAEKYAAILQGKNRRYQEQHPEIFEGAFGQDIRNESFGLGTIRAINENLTMPLLKTVNSIYNTAGFAMQAPIVGAKRALGKESEFKKWNAPLVHSTYEYLDEQTGEWQKKPEGVVSNVIDGTLHLTELLVEMSAAPSIKIMEAAKLSKGVKALTNFGFINAKSEVVVPKIMTQMAGHNFFNDFSDAIGTEDSPLLEGLIGAGVGAKDAAIFMSLGFGSSKVASILKEAGASKILTGSARTASGGILFGGYSAINQLIQDGSIDGAQLTSDIILGGGLEAFHSIGKQSNVADALAERATMRYFSSTRESINKARSTNQTPEVLRQKAQEMREQSNTHTDKLQKAGLRETADMLDGMADILAVDAYVVKNADKVKERLRKDGNLDGLQLASLEIRIEDAVNTNKINDLLNKGVNESLKKNPIEEVVTPDKDAYYKFDLQETQGSVLIESKQTINDMTSILKESTPENVRENMKKAGVDITDVKRVAQKAEIDLSTPEALKKLSSELESKQTGIDAEINNRESLPDLKEGEIRAGSKTFKDINEFEKFVKEHKDPAAIDMMETYDPKAAKVIEAEITIRSEEAQKNSVRTKMEAEKTQEGTSESKDEVSVYHGGTIPELSNEPMFVSKDKAQSEKYISENGGDVKEFKINKKDIISEKEALDIIKELGLKSKEEGWDINDLNLYELIDPNFETSFSNADIKKFYNELSKRGVKAVEFLDMNLETLKNDISNIVVVNPKETLRDLPKPQKAQKPTSEPPQTTISPETTQSATQGEKGSETAKTEKTSNKKPKEELAVDDADMTTGYEVELGGGKKPPVKPPTKTSAEPTDPVDKISKRRAERESAIKKKDRLNSKKRRWEFWVYDKLEPLKKRLIKTDSDLGRRVANRLILEPGARGRTKQEFEAVREAVLGDGWSTLSSAEQSLLSEYIDLKRTITIDEARAKAGKDQIRHEGEITGEDAKAWMDGLKNKDPRILSEFGLRDVDITKIEKSAEAYNDHMKSKLDELYEYNLIGEEAYVQVLKDNPFYSPRKYIDFINKFDRGGDISGIKALGEGSYGAKNLDIQTLLFDYTARVNSSIAKSKTFRAMDEFVQANPDNGILRKADIIKTESFNEDGLSVNEKFEFKDTPKGWENINYKDVNGNDARMWMEADAYKYYKIQEVPDYMNQVINTFSVFAGTKMLKAFATGYNPEFAIKNLPLDIQHILMTTDAYSSFLPLGIVQIHADIARIAPDVLSNGRITQDAIKHGVSMESLTTQGSLEGSTKKFGKYNNTAKALEEFASATSWAGQMSEKLTRVALYDRQIKKYTADFLKKNQKNPNKKELEVIKDDAAAYARNYLDFDQGGVATKFLDKGVPYLNAATQVTRGSLRAAGNNPVKFSFKLAQIMGATAMLTKWNTGQYDADGITSDDRENMRTTYLNDISNSVKARNFIIMTPYKYEDAQGQDRYLYLKFPKDNMQELLTGVTEDIITRQTLGVPTSLMNNKRYDELKSSIGSFVDVSQLPPTQRAIVGYHSNYDSFFEQDIWMGRDLGDDKSEEYIPGSTAERYIALGKIPIPGDSRISPVRAEYAAKQLFTESNVMATALGALIDAGLGEISPDLRDERDKSAAENIRNAPFLRRFVGSTYPHASIDRGNNPQMEYNRILQANDNTLKTKLQEGATDKDIYEWVGEMHDNMNHAEADRIEDKYLTYLEIPKEERWIYKLKFYSPIPRAQVFYELVKSQKNPQEKTRMINMMNKYGLDTDDFTMEYDKLVGQDMVKNKEQKK